MTFEEWRKTELLDDEYFHRNDMYWYAELAWNAAVRTMIDQEKKSHNSCPVCEMMMRPDHKFSYCFQCGRKL